MRKVIVIIRVLIVPVATARAASFLIAFFLLISSAKLQSKPDPILHKHDQEEFTISIVINTDENDKSDKQTKGYPQPNAIPVVNFEKQL